MKYKLIAEIASTLMLSRLKQTIIAAVGVTFSVTMFIALLGFMEGLNEMLDGLILNRTPHIRLYNEVRASEFQPIDQSAEYQTSYNFIQRIKPTSTRINIRNSRAIIKTLQKDVHVKGLASKVNSQVFYNVGNIDITGNLIGIDVEAEKKLFLFEDYVIEGRSMDLKSIPNSIILGKGAAKKMQAKLGDAIQITTSKGDLIKLKVVGYFQSGIQDLDNIQSYASLVTVQKLLGVTNNYITDIQIKLKDLNLAPALASNYKKIFKTDAIDIQSANAQYETGSKIRTLISYSVGITLLVVSGFGIYNILNMMIYEKIDSIAILKATGFSGKDVKSIFLIISLSIGLLGASSGLIFGYLLSLLIDQVPFETEALPTILTYPVNYSLKIYLVGAFFALIASYLAGFFPARKASKIDPVEILRGK